MKQNGELTYKKCNIGWTVYGEGLDSRFSCYAYVTVHAQYTRVQLISEDKEYPTIEEAKEYIIRKAKIWIDLQIERGQLRPIE